MSGAINCNNADHYCFAPRVYPDLGIVTGRSTKLTHYRKWHQVDFVPNRRSSPRLTPFDTKGDVPAVRRRQRRQARPRESARLLPSRGGVSYAPPAGGDREQMRTR